MKVSFVLKDGGKVYHNVTDRTFIPILEHCESFEEGKNNSFFVNQPTTLDALKLYLKRQPIDDKIDLETKVEFLRLASFLGEVFSEDGLPDRFFFKTLRSNHYDYLTDFEILELSAADFLYGGSFLSEECYMDNWMNSIFKMFHLLPEPSQVSLATSYWHFCFTEGDFTEYERWTCFRDHWTDMANYLWESQDRNLFCSCVGTKKFGKLHKCKTLDEFIDYLNVKQPKKRDSSEIKEKKYREVSKRGGFSTIVGGVQYKINFRKR